MEQVSLFGDTLDSPLKRFEDIHNYIYANDGLSEQQVLEEIVKILFIKYYDEQNNGNNFYVEESELNNNKSFSSRINHLFENTKQKYKTFFAGEDSLKLSTQSLLFVIRKLQKINFTSSTKDANGLAFQKFLGRYAKGGRGQFFTPDPVIDFCVQFIQPKPNEKIIDPACGTGGFLFSSLDFVKKNFKDDNLENYVKNNIFGIEINKRISQIAKIKFLIETNIDPNILCNNALKEINNLRFEKKQEINIENYFDIVLTNPPFGTQGKISQRELLSIYDLGYKWDKFGDDYIKSHNLLNGQVPEILFVEQCLKLLKPGGRAGIVLPNGHFENASLEYLRKHIKDKAHLIGIILLPQETFIPFGTGVKASLLFLQKKNGPPINDGQVFFSRIDSLGYVGNKNGATIYKKDKYGKAIIENGQKLINEDFTESISDYNKFLQTFSIESKKSFSIDSRQLNSRLDYNYYFPENRSLITNLRKLNAVKLGEIVDIVKTKSPLLRKNVNVEYVELSDVYTKSFEIINSTTILTTELPSRASYEIKTGDIITAVAGNSIGTRKHATAYVTPEFDKAICTNGFRVLRNFKINHFYLLYYLQSDLFLKQVFMYRTGAAIPALADSDFFNILIYLPSQKEIDEISSSIKRSFKLRDEAKNEVSKIKTEININRITNRCT
ncbi:MAG: N-6 DNA methylase [Candidatus Omnitrophota bacterium]